MEPPALLGFPRAVREGKLLAGNYLYEWGKYFFVTSGSGAMGANSKPGYEVVDFAAIPPVPCPCGEARRAFMATADFPGSIHVTDISADARRHYHRTLTETYYVLECGPDAFLELDETRVSVHPGMCIMIRPGTRHRAQGPMRVLIVVLPKFDERDEWFD